MGPAFWYGPTPSRDPHVHQRRRGTWVVHLASVRRHSRTSQCQSLRLEFPGWIECLLVSTLFVRRRGRPHHVSGARLSDARGEKPRENGDVKDIASVNEGTRSRLRKLFKARDGLLRGDKGTMDVDGRVTTKVGQGEGKRVVGWGELPSADCKASVD